MTWHFPSGKNLASLILAIFCLATIPAQADNSVQSLLQIRERLLASTDVIPLLKSPWESIQNIDPTALNTSQWPWKKNIITTVFWIGEKPTKNNPVPNNKSSWDVRWENNYGGFDSPECRIGFRPAGFIPKQNPFYVALPYNDIGPKGTKPEARQVIPWFHKARASSRPNKSVVKGRWLAIRNNGKVCYAQWEDCGPYRTDHWQYVFGQERPSPNRNGGAGLDVSPAVRDYLGMSGTGVTDWKFVEVQEIPRGPWSKYGENNPFSPQYTETTNKNTTLASLTKK